MDAVHINRSLIIDDCDQSKMIAFRKELAELFPDIGRTMRKRKNSRRKSYNGIIVRTPYMINKYHKSILTGEESSDCLPNRSPICTRSRAPLPDTEILPAPFLRAKQGRDRKIYLTWDYRGRQAPLSTGFYQLFVLGQNPIPGAISWRKLDVIKAKPMPMGLRMFGSGFRPGHNYYFRIRAFNKNNLPGEFSDPAFIFMRA